MTQRTRDPILLRTNQRTDLYQLHSAKFFNARQGHSKSPEQRRTFATAAHVKAIEDYVQERYYSQAIDYASGIVSSGRLLPQPILLKFLLDIIWTQEDAGGSGSSAPGATTNGKHRPQNTALPFFSLTPHSTTEGKPTTTKVDEKRKLINSLDALAFRALTTVLRPLIRLENGKAARYLLDSFDRPFGSTKSRQGRSPADIGFWQFMVNLMMSAPSVSLAVETALCEFLIETLETDLWCCQAEGRLNESYLAQRTEEGGDVVGQVIFIQRSLGSLEKHSEETLALAMKIFHLYSMLAADGIVDFDQLISTIKRRFFDQIEFSKISNLIQRFDGDLFTCSLLSAYLFEDLSPYYEIKDGTELADYHFLNYLSIDPAFEIPEAAIFQIIWTVCHLMENLESFFASKRSESHVSTRALSFAHDKCCMIFVDKWRSLADRIENVTEKRILCFYLDELLEFDQE